jgi:hypothetical protein
MTDYFDTLAPSLDGPAAGGFSISPNDSVTLPITPRAVYVGVGGSLSVVMKWGGQVTFDNVPDGTLLPIRVAKVLAASTATALLGLY